MLDLHCIGRILKTTGTRGDLKIYINEEFVDTLQKIAFIFLDLNGSKVPFRIEEIRMDKTVLLNIEDVNSETEAKMLNAAKLYIEKKWIGTTQSKAKQLTYGSCNGFTLIDLNSGKKGKIHDISQFPQQEMAHLLIEGREFLVPLNEDYIQRIKTDIQVVELILPDGFFEINS